MASKITQRLNKKDLEMSDVLQISKLLISRLRANNALTAQDVTDLKTLAKTIDL